MSKLLSRFTPASAGLLVLAVAAGAGCAHKPPVQAASGSASGTCQPAGPLVSQAVPAALDPPGDAQLFLRLRARGTQIYTCQRDAAGAWAYALKAPEAELLDDRCARVGTHFAGPTWALQVDGSQLSGKKLAEAPAPQSDAISWLLVATTPASPTGMLAPATHIQRVDTVGGKAPSEGCDEAHPGHEVAVPYRATYLYFRSAAAN